MRTFIKKLLGRPRHEKEQELTTTLLLDETDYTSTLKSSIDNYVKSERAYTPHSTRQAVKPFYSSTYCFDLIKRISDAHLLLLEVKTTQDFVKLSSYRPRQHEVNILLREIGIPVDYCYNLKHNYQSNSDSYVLEYSNTSSPSLICDNKGRIIHKQQHKNLKQYIDEIVSGSNSTNNSDLIGALFSNDIIESIQSLNLKTLFIAYDPAIKKLTVLDNKEIVQLYKTISRIIGVKKSGIAFDKENIHELKRYFKRNKELITHVIQCYEKEKEIEKQKSEQIKERNKQIKQKDQHKKFSKKRDKGISRDDEGLGF